MDRPLVSVVITAFNEERYLGEAIESVLAQTYEPVELIVVDNGSTDATGAVARSHPGVSVLELSPNRGAAGGRNAGFEASTGELISFHDADDLKLPQKLELQVRCLTENPETGIVLAGQELMLEPGTELPFWHPETRLPVRRPMLPPTARRPENFHMLTLLVRREVFERVGPFDPEIGSSEDLDWLFRAGEAGVPVQILEESLIRRRIRPESVTQDPWAVRAGIFRAVKARIDRQREYEAG